MTISNEILNNIASVFFNYYESKEDIDLAMSVLKILDFSYNDGKLLYENTEETFTKESVENFKITPLSLSSFDVDCIQTAINKPNNKIIAPRLSPLFDCIGWIIRLEVDTFRIHFIGSATYDVWKEIFEEEDQFRWKYDLEPDACDWWSGDGWNDGWNLEKDIPKNWLEDS